MDERIETYIMLLRHEMFAENLRTIDEEFIKQIVLRAGGKLNEVGDVLIHPAVRKADSGEYFVD